jgi:hypothetical protein
MERIVARPSSEDPGGVQAAAHGVTRLSQKSKLILDRGTIFSSSARPDCGGGPSVRPNKGRHEACPYKDGESWHAFMYFMNFETLSCTRGYAWFVPSGLSSLEPSGTPTLSRKISRAKGTIHSFKVSSRRIVVSKANPIALERGTRTMRFPQVEFFTKKLPECYSLHCEKTAPRRG